ncbi:MAG: S-formylglutathione hydrolase [Xanthomonadales bacterium]|uniref:S-formylglutathione hydrolase n=1 Tax=Hydrogenophaga sp. TaxID=1904254 RepID=UPI00169DF773|nr:S-formylglutathione hydrolase [Hydrogenophaga sp.]NIM70702.1 S-formylglutathione hydrolase [Xanthomonadales bacterium]NIN33457.1 S-formylglutathione hydrolase [Hydrogenophaga sp.]NIN59979.1 S-formylglutathione hydrolase [Xanthomonadales bacterium]NIN75352.1 S-formylglutathione hydrolase [Xanthomonadales bacterium]NIO13521.1 S-formylglutathione hydrolase [Xanthomonadales bacterium]
MEAVDKISAQRSCGGWLNRYRHYSEALDCEMVFGAFLPPVADEAAVPVLWWLSGLTCTDENFMQKAGAQRLAADLGLAIVCPDTSPRGTDLPGEHESYDLGSGAGFYVNATRSPWNRHYRMYDYVTRELPAVVGAHLPVNGLQSISGHSMGGHGALVSALRNPGAYQSVSAFAPICHPAGCPWGIKAFSAYLGADRDQWSGYDASCLIQVAEERLPLLIDQGTEDEFLTEQLNPGALEQACLANDHPLLLRMQESYDHSYYFVATFINDHLRHHAAALGLT